MHIILESGRVRHGFYRSETGEWNGAYTINIPGEARRIFIIASNGSEAPDDTELQWEHVSVSFGATSSKTPSWSVMFVVKDLFWDPEIPVMQLHPPRSQWVNFHPGCLHLWRPLPPNPPIPLPHWSMVGPKTPI